MMLVMMMVKLFLIGWWLAAFCCCPSYHLASPPIGTMRIIEINIKIFIVSFLALAQLARIFDGVVNNQARALALSPPCLIATPCLASYLYGKSCGCELQGLFSSG